MYDLRMLYDEMVARIEAFDDANGGGVGSYKNKGSCHLYLLETGVRQGSCRLHSFSRCVLGWAGHGAAAASLMGERVGSPMASAPGIGSLGVKPDRADGLPVAGLT
ncbi:hypothetical protein JSE7799_02718 [Jannaschia seosinensis]|uniref:Uncharacterized protein n=1 Tax=Jannaschia seosinensis TaxID=313367 RepID=A0A0M7BCS1_9RHOB|nr:hypothetical protein JSE7799_02718 [Jannaschia seosinensis]